MKRFLMWYFIIYLSMYVLATIVHFLSGFVVGLAGFGKEPTEAYTIALTALALVAALYTEDIMKK